MMLPKFSKAGEGLFFSKHILHFAPVVPRTSARHGEPWENQVTNAFPPPVILIPNPNFRIPH